MASIFNEDIHKFYSKATDKPNRLWYKCQARDFDSHIADTTISLMAYNFLSCMKAVNEYQTIGELFEQVSADWVQPNVMERFWKHFYEAIRLIAELVQKSVNELIELVVEDVDFFSKWRKVGLILGAET